MQAVLILVFISYFFGVFQLFSIGNYGFTPIDLFSVIYYFVIVKKIFWDGAELKVGKHLGVVFYFLTLLSVIISGLIPLFDGDPEIISQFFKSSLHLIFLMIFTLISFAYQIEWKVLNNIIKTWLIMGLLINLFGVYQIFARAFDLPLAWIDINNVSFSLRGTIDKNDLKQLALNYQSFYRATSIFPEPTTLASFNLSVLICLIVPWIQRQKPFIKSKLFNGFLFVITMVGTFATFSLTAVMLAVSTFGMLILLEKKKKLIYIVLVIIASSMLIAVSDSIIKNYTGASVLYLFEGRISALFRGGTDPNKHFDGESFSFRASAAKQSMILWKKSPIIGIGLGATQYNNNKEVDIQYAHYSSLNVLSECGILGFISFMGLLVVILYYFFRLNYKNIKEDYPADDKNRLIGVGFYWMLQIFMVNTFTANHFVWPSLWYLIAINFVILNNLSIEKNNYISIKVMNRPLKEHFIKTLKAYSNEIKK